MAALQSCRVQHERGVTGASSPSSVEYLGRTRRPPQQRRVDALDLVEAFFRTAVRLEQGARGQALVLPTPRVAQEGYRRLDQSGIIRADAGVDAVDRGDAL